MKRLLTTLVAISLVLLPGYALACGCFAPPAPDPEAVGSYAVNQRAELIIFEVDDSGPESMVTAHVSIQYNGDPDKFGWLLPVPSLPDLAISEALAFGVLDSVTRPIVSSSVENICPAPLYKCDYRRVEDCSPDDFEVFDTAQDSASDQSADMNNPNDPPPVDVLANEIVGSYETVVFTAQDAVLAADWLNDNGFIVNQTITPYMQPYLDAGMLFVAARLLPGAGVDEIAPLQLTYADNAPMIPLQLTAVAAEPHMQVTALIYGDEAYRPAMQSMVGIAETDISMDKNGRTNYPMVLARTIDEAGGDAWVVEYNDVPPPVLSGSNDGCCGGGGDFCGIADDGVCQCPRDEFDLNDCNEESPELIDALALLDDLASRHDNLTRLTTRLSPEEMTFDPVFVVGNPGNAQRSFTAERKSLEFCESDVIDRVLYAELDLLQSCAAVYCGEGTCGVSAAGEGGCQCPVGSVARVFDDMDQEPSVTCIPSVSTVNLALGIDVPDVCQGLSCGEGICLDVGGVATCECAPGAIAVAREDSDTPICVQAEYFADRSGPINPSAELPILDVCAPRPPSCGSNGWLVPSSSTGMRCTKSEPYSPQDTVPLENLVCNADGELVPESELSTMDPDPSLDASDTVADGWSSTNDSDRGSCGCRIRSNSQSHDGKFAGALGILLMLGVVVWRRRRGRH